MKRLGFILVMVGVLCCSCSKSSEEQSYSRWPAMADGMVKALIQNFWGDSFKETPGRYYFNYQSQMAYMTTEHYWPQAHAMDVIIDAYLRTGDKKYLDFYPKWWEGAQKYNPSGREEDPWWNVYVDDMEWIVLAQLRMYETASNPTYLEKAKQMFNQWIWPTWGPDDEAPWYGGITWKVDVQKSKNACSNGPAAIIAARLAQFGKALHEDSQSADYLKKAQQIYSWEKKTLFDEETGAVNDNIGQNGKVNHSVFTYNQGTFIGAAHELYKLTGDQQYLEDAVKASYYVILKMSNHGGALSDATHGDGGLFHGIFFRYFVRLINEEALDKTIRKEFYDYLTGLAKIMVEQGLNHQTMLYSGSWHKALTNEEIANLTPQLSGCMLMEAMCVLKEVN